MARSEWWDSPAKRGTACLLGMTGNPHFSVYEGLLRASALAMTISVSHSYLWDRTLVLRSRNQVSNSSTRLACNPKVLSLIITSLTCERDTSRIGR